MDRLAEKAESVGRSSGNVKVGLLGGDRGENERVHECPVESDWILCVSNRFMSSCVIFCPKSRRITTFHAHGFVEIMEICSILLLCQREKRNMLIYNQCCNSKISRVRHEHANERG